MAGSNWPNKSKFLDVYTKLHEGEGAELTLEDVGDVFGPQFYTMVIYLMLDANDAARAIAGSVRKLKEESNQPVAPETESVQ